MSFVEVVEVGPRDGLQNEKDLIPTADKIALIDGLSKCGFRRIEAASFVSARWVPQMADGPEVMAGITRAPSVAYTALVPNARGFELAKKARVDGIAVFAAATEGFSQANLNRSIGESLEAYSSIVKAAQAEGVPVRGYASCVTHCPYDGPTSPEAVVRVTEALLSMGCEEVSLGETLGKAMPEDVAVMLEAVVPAAGAERLAGHFHDTHGRALAAIDVALEAGLRVFDASVAGLGGCPYAPGAAGNVATEAVVTHLESKGFETGIDADALAKASEHARGLVGRET